MVTLTTTAEDKNQCLNEKSLNNNDHDQKKILEPTTKKELIGWYGYGWASEPYSVVAITVFIPILLESLTARAGVKISDYETPCDLSEENYQCVTSLGSLWFDPTSFTLYSIAISVGLQAILFITLGALADHGNWRKSFMLQFAALGAICCILFITLNPSLYWFGGILAIISNVSFGASYVFFHAFIPLLTRNHPDVIKIETEEPNNFKAIQEITEKTGNKISTHGISIGFLGGVLLLIICAIIAYFMGGTDFSLQIGIFLTGIWWLLFSLIPLKLTNSRNGLPLPKGENYLIYSWKKLFITLKNVKKLSNLFKFLLAWFLISDGYSTIASVAILFSKTVLGISQTTLILLAIAVPFCAFIGNYFFLAIQLKFNISTKTMIIIICILYSLIPIYGLIGFISDDIGFKHEWELWLLGCLHGLLLGALQSFCRVLFSDLIPIGEETEFFSLYEISDKGSSWIGPLAVGIIKDLTHDLRNAFWFLAVVMLIPIFVILTVDVQKGKEEAKRKFLDEEEIDV